MNNRHTYQLITNQMSLEPLSLTLGRLGAVYLISCLKFALKIVNRTPEVRVRVRFQGHCFNISRDIFYSVFYHFSVANLVTSSLI